VQVTAELGFPVSMMKGMVESEIQRVLKEKLG
jgi:putative polyhydroxyalkanoate system protein